MRGSNYNKFPAIAVDGKSYCGWSGVKAEVEKMSEKCNVVVIECYTGLYLDDFFKNIDVTNVRLIDARDYFLSESEINVLTKRYMTDDVLFGHVTDLRMEDFIDWNKVAGLKREIEGKRVIIIGSGASLMVPSYDKLGYADMARWEIQQRFRRHEVNGLGVNNAGDAVSIQYKRGYFIDWKVCDQLKRRVMDRVDFWIDGNDRTNPKMIPADVFAKGLKRASAEPFRVVPFFDPAPWGGHWMKEVCDLDREQTNYGWCFDCVPEENSLLLDVNGIVFEMPSINLVFAHPRALLGEAVEARFGYEFPIRFDFLDTMGGGNLSLQVHPTTQYIRETFGMQYTQDESYYMVDAGEDAVVYLGLKEGVDQDQMIADLRSAQKGEMVFDAEKYVNKLPAKKHDHYLIPGGTIHCSGSSSMVLEISSTPNLFTFKLWDWERLGLDGKPRPINVEHGKNVIDWGRDTDYVKKYLANVFEPIAEGDGWREEKTGLHRNEFIETRRHWFTKAVEHDTCGSVNVLNLVEGDECVIESPAGAFAPFTVHYAETFIIPAAVGKYIIRPVGTSEQYATMKASVRV